MKRFLLLALFSAAGAGAAGTAAGEHSAASAAAAAPRRLLELPAPAPLPEIPPPAKHTRLTPLANFPEVKMDFPLFNGPFAPTWQSIHENYRDYPAWLREAKFGIWVHF
ncbi:MAG: hypothetical protein LBR07_04185, partial [Puniceicoccales bacterium]|nr:hypothetical protein [Puniceicoccales bacterium]